MFRVLSVVLGLCWLLGCSSDGAGSATPGAGESCGPDEFSLSGTLDGESVSHHGSLQGHAWSNLGSQGRLDAPFEAGGSLHAEWHELVADGATFMATGNVNLPVAGPHGGDTLDYQLGSFYKRDNGVTFELRALALNVQCVTTPCPSGAVEGSLTGCVEWAEFMP